MKYLTTFHTHYDAIQFDKMLKSKGIQGRLRPIPRELSSSCGTCCSFEFDDDIAVLLIEGIESIHSLENGVYHEESVL